MKQAKPRGTQITKPRITQWLKDFRYYREPPDEDAIHSWIECFAHNDRDLAVRLLDCVQLVSERKIIDGYREALANLKGWDDDSSLRKGRWFFVGFGRSGESGQAMLRQFREANQLSASKHNELFCVTIELPLKYLTAEDHVVFIDDFSGSGKQICDAWPTIQELIASDAKCYLILTSATRQAVEKVKSLANLSLVVDIVLEECDNVFSSQCQQFSQAEKLVIEKYGKRADKRNPKGFGNCGLLFVLSHKTPNNTIPILHANHEKWQGLFPRYLNQMSK